MADHKPIPTHWRFQDMRGQRFGSLVVTAYVGRAGHGESLWSCACDCGGRTIGRGRNLRSGKHRHCSKRCPVMWAERQGLGKQHPSEYRVWCNMRTRCRNSNRRCWHRYGGRGIKICQRWLESFQAFYDDMGPRPSPRHQLDRIDNDGDYTPENCRWITIERQARNRSNVRRIEYQGCVITMTELAEQTGLTRSALKYRMDVLGIPLDEAVSVPLNTGRGGKSWAKMVQEAVAKPLVPC